MGQVRAAGHRLRAADECFGAAGDQVQAAAERLRAEKRYGGSMNLLCIAEDLLLLTTVMLVEQDTELG